MLSSITCCMKLEMVKLDISMFQTEKILAKEVNVVVGLTLAGIITKAYWTDCIMVCGGTTGCPAWVLNYLHILPKGRQYRPRELLGPNISLV